MFRAAGLAYGQMFERYDVWFPRAVIHSEFYRPARLDDRLRVAAYVARVGTKSLTLNFDVIRDDPLELGAAGYQTLVCVERDTLRSRPIPTDIIGALAPYTLPVEQARSLLGVKSR